MTDDRSLNRAARTFIEIGPTRAPERAVERALLLIESTPQERDLRILRRFQDMNPFARMAVAAVVVVLAAGAAFYLLKPAAADVATAPSQSIPLSPIPSASAGQPTIESYVRARDAICRPAIAQVTTLNEQMAKLHPATSSADLAALVTNLSQVIAVGTTVTDGLAQLDPPAVVAADHAADVTHHRDSIAVLNEALAKLQAGKVAEGLAISDATNPLSSAEEAFERKYGLSGCP
jgi:hypothetical protein